MNLSDNINVNVRFQRSTRIDSDLDRNGDFFNGFVFHGTAENTLRTIAEGYQQSHRKTYTVTGPYGTGKSTIALLLAGLLSDQKIVRKVANTVVGNDFLELFYDKFNVKKGWFIVKVVCSFESPIQAIWRSLEVEALEHKIDISSIEKPIDESTFFTAFNQIIKKIEKKFDGVVILLDEMGKSLEYLNSKGLDLQFFQDFAEKISRKKLPIFFIGFLHQAFAEYARGQSQATKDSWAKVQGRYTDLLFNVSEDETVTLIGNSIVQDNQYKDKVSNKVVSQTLDAISESSVAAVLNIDSKLQKALPLHPLTSLLLGPLSKRRFSQNERSTFGFLSSAENYGFQSFLKSNTTEKLYRLHDLYNYIDANLDHLILSSPDARTWSEAKDAVERTQARSKGFVEQLIKTIAILNMFARKMGLYATKVVLYAALEETPAVIDKALKELITNKVIIYRTHLQSYAVFEGSDVDIDDELEKERLKLSTSDEWKTFLSSKSDHVVAKGHYHEVGVLRWMKLVFETGSFDINKFNKQHKLNSTEFSVFVLLISGDKDIAQLFSNEYNDYVFGTAPKLIEQLKYLINDLISLENINRHNPIIQHDRIARRELQSRISLTQLNFDKLYAELFNAADWFKQGKQISGKSLSQVASEVASEIYSGAPKLYNELINRAKPSGAAVGARKKLMQAMVNDYYVKDLGIEGTPPEMAMYKSCLQHQQLHMLGDDDDYEFVMPKDDKESNDTEKSQSQVVKIWAEALKVIQEESKNGVVNLQVIHDLWSTKPYGLTAGLIPIWTLSLLLAQTDNLAFYDKDVTNRFIYITGPDDEFVNKLIKEPKNVGIRYFEVSGVKKSHINALNRIINSESNDKNALAVAQSFVRFVAKLSGWVKTTKQLSKYAIIFRDLALKADDPHKFLLEDLPKGLETTTDEDLIKKITDIHDELKTAHNQMLKVFKGNIDKLFATSFDENFLQRAESVDSYSADYKLKTFAQRLTEFTSVDTERWISNIISLLSGKAERNWNDSAIEKAKSELVVFVERFKQAEYFATNIGEVDNSLLDKNHEKEMNKIDKVVSGLSLKEQQVILMKSLEALLGNNN